MWELGHKEGWVSKNWSFQITVLDKTLESPLDCKEIKPVNPKGNQPWIFIGRTDAEAEAPILWPPGAKSWLIGKDPEAGKDWEQEEKGVIEDEMVGWYHWLNWHEFEKTPGDSEGQGRLVCCSPWDVKNWTRLGDWTEKVMAPYSSTLAWKISWMEKPGGLQSMGSQRVRHDWATSLSLFPFMHWRRKWQPTPVFLPGESQGEGRLVGCRLWGCTESDTTEVT